MGRPKRIRTPLSRRIRRARYRVMPVLAFGGAVADVDASWRAFAAKKRYPKRRRR